MTALLQVCLIWSWPVVAYGQNATAEYRMKAVYLRKIPSFVQWPERRGIERVAEGEPMHLCVIGNYSFGLSLVQEAEAATTLGARMDVRYVSKGMEWKGCQVVFVSQSEQGRYGKILDSLRGKNVLTVGETSGFLEAGGIVELKYVNEGMQIAVNLDAARAAELKLDARLVSVAKRVIQAHEKAGS